MMSLFIFKKNSSRVCVCSVARAHYISVGWFVTNCVTILPLHASGAAAGTAC